MKKATCLVLILIFFAFCGPKRDVVEKIIEDGIEVVINHLEPYKISGEPHSLNLIREFAIDTEDEKLLEIGLIGIESFDVDEEPEPVSTTCVLFAKAEMLGLLKKGYTVNQALAAYCSAMSYRVFTMIKEVDVVEDFVITGGIAKNRGIVERLEKHIGLTSLKTEVDYQLAGAIGAALFGKVLYEKKMKK